MKFKKKKIIFFQKSILLKVKFYINKTLKTKNKYIYKYYFSFINLEKD